MPSRAVKKHSPVGSKPGLLRAPEGARESQIRLTRYDDHSIEELPGATLEDIRAAHASGRKIWVDVRGLKNLDLLEAIAQVFGIHLLALEDVLNVPQRPKEVAYGDHHQIVLQMLVPHHLHRFEQLSLFVGEGWVVTFQEQYEDDFEGVRERLRAKPGRLRTSGSDYLAYALLDAVVDAYFPHLGTVQRSLEDVELEVFDDGGENLLARMHALRSSLLELRRAAWPQREIVQSLLRGESRFFHARNQPYLRDVYDHAIEILDQIDSSRDTVGNLTQVHLALMGQRTNEVMRWLTVMASLFIPLTFVVGVYGMNFAHMPELHWRWSYPLLWLLMVVVTVVMLWFFARRGWLRGD